MGFWNFPTGSNVSELSTTWTSVAATIFYMLLIVGKELCLSDMIQMVRIYPLNVSFFFTPVFFSIRKFCTGLVYAAIFALVFFWAVPVGFISALITLKNIAKVAPWLDAGESFNQYITQHQHTYSLSSPLYIFHGNDKEKFFHNPKLSCLLNV